MQDVYSAFVITLIISLVLIQLLSWILSYFVALNARPAKRAASIVGISYLTAAIASSFAEPSNFWVGPLGALPVALVVYWFWRRGFQRDWIDDDQPVPEGVELATDDWRVGLLELLILITIGAGWIVLRFAVKLIAASTN